MLNLRFRTKLLKGLSLPFRRSNW